MKRTSSAANVSDDDAPAPKRRPLPRALPITSPDAKAVRATYHTDCVIVATGGDAPHREFPVNRVIVGSWSEAFRVMVDGSFAEGVNARIELPYTSAIAEIVVQHMYALMRLAEVPEVPPECAYEVLQVAHMHERRDLFEIAESQLYKSALFSQDATLTAAVLRTLLAMGLNVKDLYAFYKAGRRNFLSFALDVDDDVLKPFISLMMERPNAYELYVPSKYTDEVRHGAAYYVESPTEWERNFLSYVDTSSFNRRGMNIARDIAAFAPITKCGIITRSLIMEELQRVIASGTTEDKTEARRLLALFKRMADASFEEYGYLGVDTIAYRSLMRKIHPLPPFRKPVASK